MAALWYVLADAAGRHYCGPNRVELAMHVAARDRRLGVDRPLPEPHLEYEPWEYCHTISGLPDPAGTA